MIKGPLDQNLLNQHLQRETYLEGDLIVTEGSDDSDFYIVLHGVVQVIGQGNNGQKLHLGQLSRGESFGQLAFLEEKSATTSVLAATDVVLLRISEKSFGPLFDGLPIWALCLMKTFIYRFEILKERIKEVEMELANKK